VAVVEYDDLVVFHQPGTQSRSDEASATADKYPFALYSHLS
jgi:hypothetical protein